MAHPTHCDELVAAVASALAAVGDAPMVDQEGNPPDQLRVDEEAPNTIDKVMDVGASKAIINDHETGGDKHHEEHISEPEAEATADSEEYEIDTGILDFKSPPAISYRLSKQWDDLTRVDPAPSGSRVVGVDEGEGWLKVGQRYLPMEHEGVTIIFPVTKLDEALG